MGQAISEKITSPSIYGNLGGLITKSCQDPRKGQVRNIGGSDIRSQAEFIAGLFGAAA